MLVDISSSKIMVIIIMHLSGSFKVSQHLSNTLYSSFKSAIWSILPSLAISCDGTKSVLKAGNSTCSTIHCHGDVFINEGSHYRKLVSNVFILMFISLLCSAVVVSLPYCPLGMDHAAVDRRVKTL